MCSRPCKNGRPCQKAALPWDATWQQVIPTLPNPVSCIIHLTPEERADLDSARDRYRHAVEERADRDPACWSWLAPPAHSLGDPADLDDEELAQYEDAAWDLLADWQSDRCGVCGGRSAVLDHDHVTGLVRGWLCRGCNIREGKSSTGRLDKYRQRPPAAILGVRMRYYDPFTGYALAAALAD